MLCETRWNSVPDVGHHLHEPWKKLGIICSCYRFEIHSNCDPDGRRPNSNPKTPENRDATRCFGSCHIMNTIDHAWSIWSVDQKNSFFLLKVMQETWNDIDYPVSPAHFPSAKGRWPPTGLSRFQALEKSSRLEGLARCSPRGGGDYMLKWWPHQTFKNWGPQPLICSPVDGRQYMPFWMWCSLHCCVYFCHQ